MLLSEALTVDLLLIFISSAHALTHISVSLCLYLQPNLRGATLVADFEDHATELIDSMPSNVKKELKKIKKDDDLNKKEVKKAQNKVIKKWERNTEKNCVEHLSASTCDAAKKCVWMKDNTCVAKKALYEDYFFDSSEDYVADQATELIDSMPSNVKKELKVEEDQEGR